MSSDTGLPRELRTRLPNGVVVSVRMDDSDNSGTIQAREQLARLLESGGLTSKSLLEFLQNFTPVVFPLADPASSAQVLDGPDDCGIDLSYRMDSGMTGAVQIKGARTPPSSRLFRDAIQRIAANSGIGYAHVIAGYGELNRIRAEIGATSWPFPIEVLSWNELVNRIAVPDDEQDRNPFTVVLIEIVDSSRRLLSQLARHRELLKAIDDRRLEELVAVLLHDLGFEQVELTPPRKDGGKDVVATHRNRTTGLQEVYLFECKHWLSGKKVTLSLVTRLQAVVAKNQAKGGVILATGGFGPRLVEQELRLKKKSVFLKGEHELLEWIGAWERSYGSPLMTSLDPLSTFGITGL